MDDNTRAPTTKRAQGRGSHLETMQELLRAASCHFRKHRYHQDIMPLLTGAKYPMDIVNRQKHLLSLKGYHVVFDEVCTKKNWEKDLPCSVKDGLIINILAYQTRLSSSNYTFRFCINHFSKSHYVEIGDYLVGKKHYVQSRLNHVSGNVRRSDLIPAIGTYFWVQFYFESGDKCKFYFKSVFIDERSTNYVALQTLFVHGAPYNASDILSIHIVTQSGASPLDGNLSNKPFGFMFVTSKITVQGRGSTSSTDKTIQFSIRQHDREDSTKKTFALNPGQQTVSKIEFQILSFGVTALAGDGSTTGRTDCDGSKEVILRIVNNFYVEKVIVRTGMYNSW